MSSRPHTNVGLSAGRTLRRVVADAGAMEPVLKSELRWGDRVLLRTRNSLYTLVATGQEDYLVSGGWFDHQGLSPARVAVSGCTWGGHAVKQDAVAAPGLFLEFGNGVQTTRILEVTVIPFTATVLN